jgi:hypothetical protein
VTRVERVSRGEPDQGEVLTEVFALVTDLLDVGVYPALHLAGEYPMRWGCSSNKRIIRFGASPKGDK